MASYSVPGQNLTYNLPDEGQTFRSVGDNTNSSLYQIKDGKLVNLATPQYVSNADAHVDGKVYKPGDIIPRGLNAADLINPGAVSGAYNGTISAGDVYNQTHGANAYSSLPTFNMGDLNQVLDRLGGAFTPGATGYTQGVAANNPNSATITTNTGQNLTGPAPAPQAGAITPTPGYTNPNAANPVTGAQGAPVGTAPSNNAPANSQYPAQTANQGGANANTPAENGQINGTTPQGTTAAPTGYTGPSIVDYLHSVGQLSDFSSRATLAQQYGIQNYTGTAAQNTQLLNTLRSQGITSANNPGTNASGITTGGTLGGGTQATQQGTTGTPDPYAGMSPIDKQVAMYTDAYKALGLETIKQSYEDVIKQQQDLTDKMNAKIADVNNNPWLSEGLRTKEIQKIQDANKTSLDTLTHLQTLYDSLYKQGQAQVEHIVSGAQADVKAANDLAQKQLDAANALAKDNQVVSIGGNEVLVNKATGKTVAVLGPTPAASKAATSTGTAAERAQAELDQYSKAFVPGARTADGTPVIDNNGFVNPSAWKSAIADYSGTRANFIKEFGYLLYTDKNGVSPAYGITPTEQKLITGAL